MSYQFDYKGFGIRVKGDRRVEVKALDTTTASIPGLTNIYTSTIDAKAAIDAYLPDEDRPTLVSISPTEAEIGGEDVTLVVTGTNFLPGCVINFNGGDESTVYVSETELTTIVKPSLASVEITVPVTVRQDIFMTSPQDFSFVAPVETVEEEEPF